MPSAPLIAAIRYDRGFPINGTFRAVVTALRRSGINAGGILEEEIPGSADTCRTQLNVVDIWSGEAARITQECGNGSRGCKLDERGLAMITPRIIEAIEACADLIVINKFGRAEAEGGGLLACIAEAVSAGIPVLTSVREPYLEQWLAFRGGLGIELVPRVDVVAAWCRGACGKIPALATAASFT